MVHVCSLPPELLMLLANFSLRSELKFAMPTSHRQQAGESGCICTEGREAV